MIYFVSENCFILANSADPDEMLHKVAFNWVLTVCQSTCLLVSRMKRVKDKRAMTCDFQQCGILTSVDSGEPV